MRKFYWLLVILFGLCSCSKDDETDVKLCFIGDSMIANWDVERYFPNRIVENLGKDGIGIAEMTAFTQSNPSADAIVLIGTNDIKSSMTDEQVENYIEQYIYTIEQLKYRRIVLISILPTSNESKNQRIKKVNAGIKEALSHKSNIVYVDCYDVFLRGDVIKEELSREGLHLNDYGYILLTDKVKGRL